MMIKIIACAHAIRKEALSIHLRRAALFPEEICLPYGKHFCSHRGHTQLDIWEFNCLVYNSRQRQWCNLPLLTKYA